MITYQTQNNELIAIKIKDKKRQQGRFYKGHRPWNKGKKGLSNGGDKTYFKKGNMPHNTLYDGCISIRRDNKGRYYKHIRIAKARWEFLHRYLWKKYYGAIPEGNIVVFKDGNTMNCAIDNLECISRKENMERNRNREKASKKMQENWRMEKLRGIYGLKRKTKLRIKIGGKNAKSNL